MKKITLIVLMMISFQLYGRDEMADVMRSNGKIYVVVAVACVVFAVITAYLVVIDRKVMRLEKKNSIQ